MPHAEDKKLRFELAWSNPLNMQFIAGTTEVRPSKLGVPFSHGSQSHRLFVEAKD